MSAATLFEGSAEKSTKKPVMKSAEIVPLASAPPEPESAPAVEGEEFGWGDDDGCVVLKEQYATACYFNREHELVIKQRRWPDDDQCIFIAPHSIAEFLDKLCDICGVGSARP